MLPAGERSQDPEREGYLDALAQQVERPLDSRERRAAEEDVPLPERVYAPASRRVPRRPAPGHQRLIDEGLAHQSEARRRGALQVARQTGAEPPR